MHAPAKGPLLIDLHRRSASRECNTERNIVSHARLGIQMLRLHFNLLNEGRQQQLRDYAQKPIEEQRTERGTAATV